MHFVDDRAVEAIPPARRRPRLHSPAVPRPRCANPKSGSSTSIGRASSGRLVQGCELPDRGLGWVRRNRDGWGTDRTVALLERAVGVVIRRHPSTVAVVIGALSRRGGGRLGQHKSHQSGRDVDIGYYAVGNRPLPHFRRMGPGNFDIAKTWTLIGALLATGEVQYIFMDYNLQALMVHHLRDEGLDPVRLARIFQFPARRTVRRGIIRHARGHRDHFHVRFRCPPDDEECEN